MITPIHEPDDFGPLLDERDDPDEPTTAPHFDLPGDPEGTESGPQ